jgi:hypothetical protein
MPKELEDKLKKQAGQHKGWSDERKDAYVYGTMRKTGWKPSREKEHGSLEDITFMEDAATCDTAIDGTNTHAIHKGYKGGGQKTPDSGSAIQWGSDNGWKEDGDEPKGSVMSANRDNGWGVHYGATVDYFGPDTDYRAEEIDPHQYGRAYDPYPFRDYYKTDDKMNERTFRVMEQDKYDETATPGAVADSMPHVEAHGAVNHEGAGPDREVEDYRSFASQRRFARTNKEKSEEYAVDISGLDTKEGKDIQ